jgi:MFS family permease
MTEGRKNGKNGKSDESPTKQPLPYGKALSQSAWISLGILGSTLLIIMYSQTMLIPAIPDIIKEFNISYSSASWILTSYLISGAVMTPIGGKLSDIYGRKKIILVVMLVYIIGTSLGGLSTDITSLIFSRAIQGVGISMLPLAFGMIRDQFPRDKLAIGVGIFSSMFAAGSVVGLAAGANIIQNLGWHFTFLLVVPFAIMLWYIIRKFIYDSRYPVSLLKADSSIYPHQDDNINVKKMNGYDLNALKSLDIRGALTLSITIGSFLIILSDLGTNEINNGIDDMSIINIIVLLITGSISLLFFISTERKSKSPLIDFNLIGNRIILSANILLLISFLSMFMVYQTIPVLVRSPDPVGLDGDAITTANVQLSFTFISLIFAPISGFVISKLGNIKPIIAGTAITTIGFFLLLALHYTDLLLATSLSIIATGLSLAQVGGLNIVLTLSPRHLIGISIGMTALFNLMGAALGPVIAGTYMQANRIFVKDANEFYPSSLSYDQIFFTAALLSLVSIALSYIIKKTISSSDSQLQHGNRHPSV